MYLHTHLHFNHEWLTRMLGAVAMAMLITFGLFVLMDQLTRQDQVYVDPTEPLVPIDAFYTEPDENIITKTELPPRQPPKVIPRTNLPELDNEPDGNANPVVTVPYTPPEVDNTIAGPVIEDSQARPIVRMQPQYPVAAARDGIEGWVKMVFSIDAAGRVTDIEVIDAEPKRIFDREARRALSKWKYKPQLIDGKPVAQSGLQVVLDFRLGT